MHESRQKLRRGCESLRGKRDKYTYRDTYTYKLVVCVMRERRQTLRQGDINYCYHITPWLSRR